MSVKLFVYGTLKEGFPNHSVNQGRRLAGVYKTTDAYPLLVVRLPDEDRAPWLVDQPGWGLQVAGQLFEVDSAAMPAIDRLEELGLPSGYVRKTIEVVAVAELAARIQALSI